QGGPSSRGSQGRAQLFTPARICRGGRGRKETRDPRAPDRGSSPDHRREAREMTKGRLEAFSDGVIAVIITILVLELKVPHGAGTEALVPLIPGFLSYALSFIFIGIYWNNHHHLMHVVRHVNGAVLWANLHLLFWLSLAPFVTAW